MQFIVGVTLERMTAKIVEMCCKASLRWLVLKVVSAGLPGGPGDKDLGFQARQGWPGLWVAPTFLPPEGGGCLSRAGGDWPSRRSSPLHCSQPLRWLAFLPLGLLTK